jgi:predicted DNA-binding protein (UPF0251 family)
MPRPIKCRKVDYNPGSKFFKPAGIPVSELEVSVLALDELEALRLADYEGLYQEEAARKMNISRQTFGNIISSARSKTADALINGKAIKIEGGHIAMAERKFVCLDCKYEWILPFGTGHPEKCPGCGSVNIQRVKEDYSVSSRGRGCGRR